METVVNLRGEHEGGNDWVNYYIFNEDEEIMRVVHRLEEAEAICALRNGWTYVARRRPVRKVDLSQLGEALI